MSKPYFLKLSRYNLYTVNFYSCRLQWTTKFLSVWCTLFVLSTFFSPLVHYSRNTKVHFLFNEWVTIPYTRDLVNSALPLPKCRSEGVLVLDISIPFLVPEPHDNKNIVKFMTDSSGRFQSGRFSNHFGLGFKGMNKRRNS